MELSEILNSGAQSDPAPEPTPAPAEPAERTAPSGDTPAPEPTETRQRDEHGRFVGKPQGEQEPAPPAGRQDHGPIPIQALLDEREKRQRAERELEEWRRRAAPPPSPPQRPDVFADPDGAFSHIEQQVSEQVTRARLDMSVMMEQSSKPDYAEKESAFIEAVKANPALYQQMLADPHPAGFAYRVGSQVLAMREIGDPAGYRERIEKELREKLEAEYAAKYQQVTPPPQATPLIGQAPLGPSAFPTSLSTARAAAPRSPAPAFNGPTPLSALGNPALRMG
jgi:hypothetical protein